MNCYVKLVLIKKENNNHNDYSRIFVDNIKNENLKKIRSTTKVLETEQNYKPYISYTQDDVEYKLYDYNEVDKFLDNLSDLDSKTSFIFNYMMESKL
tara:strand:+ start:231 stop:521 length:291 start_codon:yes stop_codon:yes gene_type:complete